MGENLTKTLILAVVGFVVVYAFMQKPGAPRKKYEGNHSEVEAMPSSSGTEGTKSIQKVTPPPVGTQLRNQSRMVPKIHADQKKPNANALKYRLEDGVAVVQGDVVIGEIVTEEGQEPSESGYVAMPTVKLWPQREIAFYIQPSVQNPERVTQALAMFADTAIHFVPFSGQQDVMVFEDAAGECKSYVGWIGGKQPLWIGQGCQPDDIAHEILHALGFVHEQNRSDRDQFVRLIPENIDERYQDNFYRLPQELMKVSGLAPFDFESLMMYSPEMFSKNGQPTMQSKIKDREIRPSKGLSPSDIERVNKAYGNR